MISTCCSHVCWRTRSVYSRSETSKVKQQHIIQGCLQLNVGSPELKWELRAKPGLKKTEDVATRSTNIFITGAAKLKLNKKIKKTAGLGGQQLGDTISWTRLHFSCAKRPLLNCQRAPPSLLAAGQMKTDEDRCWQMLTDTSLVVTVCIYSPPDLRDADKKEEVDWSFFKSRQVDPERNDFPSLAAAHSFTRHSHIIQNQTRDTCSLIRFTNRIKRPLFGQSWWELSEVLTATAPSWSLMRPKRIYGAFFFFFLRCVCRGEGA